MILYHASTLYHLFFCIIHKMTKHENEECRLIVVEYVVPKKDLNDFINKLKGTNWFKRVDIIEERKFMLIRGGVLDENSSESKIKSIINNVCNAYEKWLDEDIAKYKEIYVAPDTLSTGIYLLNKKIPFNYIEDANGMLSQEKRYLEIIKNFNKTTYIICQYLKGAGRNRIVKSKICDMNNQKDGFKDDRAVHFSIYESLVNKIPNKINELLEFYNVKKIQVDNKNKTCLFLTQYLKTLAIKELDVQEIITTLLFDYVCEGYSIIIKPHPKDEWLNYKRICRESTVLPNNFPSELLAVSFNRKVNRAVTASSTSIGGVKNIVDETFEFGVDIESSWEWLHQMYAVSRILKLIGENKKLVMSNINELQMNNMLKLQNVKLDDTGKNGEILINGDLNCNNFNPEKYDFIINLSLSNKLNWVIYDEYNNIILVTVKVIPEDESLLEEKTFRIFLKIKSIDDYKKLKELSEIKKLKYSKVILKIDSIEVNKNLAHKFNIEILRELNGE